MSGRLLLVEPDPTLRGQLARFLVTLDYTVDAVDTAGAALAAIQAQAPELTLLDTHLAEDPATVAFATQHAAAGLIVLGRPEAADRLVADIRSEIRPDHVLYKPFSAQGLADAVRQTLADREAKAAAAAERASATDELDAQLSALQAALADLGSEAAPPTEAPDDAPSALDAPAPTLDASAPTLDEPALDADHGLLDGDPPEPTSAPPIPHLITGPLLDDAAIPARLDPAALEESFTLRPMTATSPQDPQGIYGPVLMPDLLYNCFRDLFSGWLVLRHGAVEKTVLWRAGRPIQAQSNVKAETLGALLVDSGRLRATEHERALAQMSARGQRLGQTLVELGLITEGELRQALLEQVRMRVMACFDWTDATYGLTYDQHAGEGSDAFEINPLLLIFDGIKSAFPLAPLVAHYDRLIRSAPCVTDTLNDYRTMLRAYRDELRVADLCDGSRALGEVLSLSPYSLIETLRIIRALEAMSCVHYDRGRDSAAPPGRAGTGGYRTVRRASTAPQAEKPANVRNARSRDERPTTGGYRTVRRNSGAVPPVDPKARRSKGPAPVGAPRPARRSNAPSRGRRSVSKGPPAAPISQQMTPADLVAHLEAQAGHYALLGVRPQASGSTIRSVASALIRSLSKVMTGGDALATRAKAQFDRINKAGEVLAHPRRRAAYDALHMPIAPPSGVDLMAAETDFKRGRLCLAQSNLERAHAWFERAAAQDPHKSIYRVYLGWTTFERAEPANRRARIKALELAREALKSDTSRDDGHVLVGSMYQALGSTDAALRAFQKALEINRNNADAQAGLSQLADGAPADKKADTRLFGKLFTRR